MKNGTECWKAENGFGAERKSEKTRDRGCEVMGKVRA
ncbi:hypothetical protein T4E_11837 [Trichinella pseudospiralis]|uniref:Uncharacterized protein n=1 Tax=Trichinella pseudospiralis TaxID=6337 RepID=A0A0V0WP69_TRIPS|nr:hypothetical protein T4E_11837 [Trichinella pseudospiralis]